MIKYNIFFLLRIINIIISNDTILVNPILNNNNSNIVTGKEFNDISLLQSNIRLPNIFTIYGIKFHKNNEMLIKTLVINFIVYLNVFILIYITKFIHFLIGYKHFYCNISIHNKFYFFGILIHTLFFLFINGFIIFIIKLKFKSFDWKKYLLDSIFFIICNHIYMIFLSYLFIRKYYIDRYKTTEKNDPIVIQSLLKRNWQWNDILGITIFVLYIIIINFILIFNIINYKEYTKNIFIFKYFINKQNFSIKKNDNKNNKFLFISIVLFCSIFTVHFIQNNQQRTY